MTNWNRSRKVSFAVHLAFIALPLALATAAAFNWWSSAFGDPWIAAALIATLEILGITSLILYIQRVQWPLMWLRHLIPLFSTIPFGYELYTYLEPNVGIGGAIPLACAVVVWFAWIEFILLRSFETLFITPLEAVQEATRTRMESLALNLSEWQTAATAVRSFAQSVVMVDHAPQGLEDVQPTMPRLLPAPNANPKMLDIARAALLRGSTGEWLLTVDDIVRDTHIERSVVLTVVKLVRGGHLVFEGGI